jgi:hypothetical protein
MYPVSFSRLSWAAIGLRLCDTDSDLATRIRYLLLTDRSAFPRFEAPSRGVLAAITDAFGGLDARQRRLERRA